MAVAVDRRIVLALSARCGPTNDCATLRPLADIARQRGPIGVVLADAEFDSERNHQHIRHAVQAYSVIPAKRGAAQWKIQGTRAQRPQACPAHLYRRWSLIESLISTVKRKLSARAPGRLLLTQCRQAVLLGSADNLYRL
jgi:Transposase DDE domain